MYVNCVYNIVTVQKENNFIANTFQYKKFKALQFQIREKENVVMLEKC